LLSWPQPWWCWWGIFFYFQRQLQGQSKYIQTSLFFTSCKFLSSSCPPCMMCYFVICVRLSPSSYQGSSANASWGCAMRQLFFADITHMSWTVMLISSPVGCTDRRCETWSLGRNQYPLPTMSDASQPSIAMSSGPHPESSLPQQPSHPTRYKVYRPSSQAAPALRKDPSCSIIIVMPNH
jgi:hypothetical protein